MRLSNGENYKSRPNSCTAPAFTIKSFFFFRSPPQTNIYLENNNHSRNVSSSRWFHFYARPAHRRRPFLAYTYGWMCAQREDFPLWGCLLKVKLRAMERRILCLLSERTRSKSDSHCVFVSILLSSVAKRVISAGGRRSSARSPI